MLDGVVCQTLVPAADGRGTRLRRRGTGSHAPAIRNLIREDKAHLIYAAMQAGQKQRGMQTINQALAALYRQQCITLEQALDHAANREELEGLAARGRDETGWLPQRGASR